jgi:hypothetical protein
MNKYRIYIGMLMVGLVVVGAVVLIPTIRQGFLGVLRGEAFYEGKPQSYWVEQMRVGNSSEARTAFFYMGRSARGAAPALLEVLKTNEDVIRRQDTASALGHIGPRGTAFAIPALTEALNDE